MSEEQKTQPAKHAKRKRHRRKKARLRCEAEHKPVQDPTSAPKQSAKHAKRKRQRHKKAILRKAAERLSLLCAKLVPEVPSFVRQGPQNSEHTYDHEPRDIEVVEESVLESVLRHEWKM